MIALADAKLLIASGDDLTDSDDLGRKMMRQVAGAFAEYEKLPSGRQTAERSRAQTQGDRQQRGWPEITR
ncbi:MAG: hypothetical protein WAO08_10910 [Hyphomicrobiaceae bacterium]